MRHSGREYDNENCLEATRFMYEHLLNQIMTMLLEREKVNTVSIQNVLHMTEWERM